LEDSEGAKKPSELPDDDLKLVHEIAELSINKKGPTEKEQLATLKKRAWQKKLNIMVRYAIVEAEIKKLRGEIHDLKTEKKSVEKFIAFKQAEEDLETLKQDNESMRNAGVTLPEGGDLKLLEQMDQVQVAGNKVIDSERKRLNEKLERSSNPDAHDEEPTNSVRPKIQRTVEAEVHARIVALGTSELERAELIRSHRGHPPEPELSAANAKIIDRYEDALIEFQRIEPTLGDRIKVSARRYLIPAIVGVASAVVIGGAHLFGIEIPGIDLPFAVTFVGDRLEPSFESLGKFAAYWYLFGRHRDWLVWRIFDFDGGWGKFVNRINPIQDDAIESRLNRAQESHTLDSQSRAVALLGNGPSGLGLLMRAACSKQLDSIGTP